jgi:hypothetical protein
MNIVHITSFLNLYLFFKYVFGSLSTLAIELPTTGTMNDNDVDDDDEIDEDISESTVVQTKINHMYYNYNYE